MWLGCSFSFLLICVGHCWPQSLDCCLDTPPPPLCKRAELFFERGWGVGGKHALCLQSLSKRGDSCWPSWVEQRHQAMKLFLTLNSFFFLNQRDVLKVNVWALFIWMMWLGCDLRLCKDGTFSAVSLLCGVFIGEGKHSNRRKHTWIGDQKAGF